MKLQHGGLAAHLAEQQQLVELLKQTRAWLRTQTCTVSEWQPVTQHVCMWRDYGLGTRD